MDKKNTAQANLQTQSTHSIQTSKAVDLQTSVQRIDAYLMAGKLSIGKALEGRQLSSFKRTEGDKAITAVVATYLLSLAMAYNVNKTIAEEQAAGIAQIILRDYWFLKLAEIALFIDKAKSGRYGTAYGSIDRPTVIRWLDAYCLERDEWIEQDNVSRTKSLPSINQLDPRVAEAVKHLAEAPLKGKLERPEEATRLYPPSVRKSIEAERNKNPEKRDQPITDGEIYEKLKSKEQ